MRKFALLFLLFLVLMPAKAQNMTRVYIALKSPLLPQEDDLAVIKPAVDAAQAALFSAFPRSTGFETVYIYETVFGVSANVDQATWDALRLNPVVESVTVVPVAYLHLDAAVPMINADDVHRDFGYTGAGINVAVIDSGIDRNHPALADSIVAQRCFAAPNGCPGGTSVSPNATDANDHGTHVAGIITANGNGLRGFAPGAGIVPVRVFSGVGQTSFDNVVKAVDWVGDNRATLKVRIINMSLGTSPIKESGYGQFCDSADPTFMALRNAIARSGAIAFASAGNDHDPNYVGAPACLSNVIAVGDVYSRSYASINWTGCTDAPANFDSAVCHSNGGPLLDLLAPGAMINSTVPGGYGIKGGTSMASPAAAAVGALMLQARPSLTAGEMLEIMQDTGPLRQHKNGQYYPRLDAAAAVGALLPPQRFELVSPLSNAIITNTQAFNQFTWDVSPGAARYHFRLFRTSQTPDALFRLNGLTPQSDGDPLACTSNTCTLTINNTLRDFLIDGTYTWTVIARNASGQRKAANSGSRFYINTYDAAIGLIRNGGFEDDTHGDTAPQFWTPARLTKDMVVCNKQVYEGKCVFRFMGGSGEASQLVQSPDVSSANLGAGFRLTLSAFVRASGSPSATIRTIVYYTNATPARDTMLIPIKTATTEYEGVARKLDLRADVQKVKVILLNKSTSGAVFVDRLSLVVSFTTRRDNRDDKQSGNGWLPLPPSP